MGTQATAVEIKVKANDYVSIYPKTSTEQIEGKKVTETYGPFPYILRQDGWTKDLPSKGYYKQIISDDNTKELKDADRPLCNKVLEGTVDQMILQQKAYDMLDSVIGINAVGGKLEFVATEKPPIDIKIQVYWTTR